MAKASTSMLPRAYLRMSPNLDMHPDPEAMVLLLCAANRQPVRGRFRDRETLVRILGRGRFKRLLEREDLVLLEDGRWYVEGWDEWQEGDLTVADRQRRIRDNRVTQSQRGNGHVTSESRRGHGASVTQPLLNRDPPSRRETIGESRETKDSQGRIPETARAPVAPPRRSDVEDEIPRVVAR